VELLRRSTLCITHAGLNTALESLTQGVPMVAIPVSIDQPGVAARIAYTKTGAYVSIQDLTVSRLSTLIDDVLDDPKYRHNANTMKEAIVRTNGLEKATDLLEQAFGLPLEQQEPSGDISVVIPLPVESRGAKCFLFLNQ
jgi:zeaxanthin glucosyltransferase